MTRLGRRQVIGSVAIVVALAACSSSGGHTAAASYVNVSPHQPVTAAQAKATVGAEQISNVTRIEAKLMSAGQALDALWPDSEKPPISRSTPVWVVAARGTFRPSSPDNKQHTYPWAVFLVDASSFGFAGQPGYMSTTLADVRGTSGTWPAHFDALPDASNAASMDNAAGLAAAVRDMSGPIVAPGAPAIDPADVSDACRETWGSKFGDFVKQATGPAGHSHLDRVTLTSLRVSDVHNGRGTATVVWKGAANRAGASSQSAMSGDGSQSALYRYEHGRWRIDPCTQHPRESGHFYESQTVVHAAP